MTSYEYYLYLDMEYFILFLSGIVGGLIAGLLGLGGGIFYIMVLPFVIQWYGISAEDSSAFVVANSLLGICIASGSSMVTAFKKLKIYIKESLMIGIPAIIISLLTTHFIVHSEWFSKELFNGFVVLLMIFILIQMIVKTRKTTEISQSDSLIPLLPAAIGGSISGLISAISGLGGGIIIIPLLQIKFKQSLKKSKLISLTIIFLSSLLLSIQNLLSETNLKSEGLSQIGYILPSIAIPIVFGVVIGGPLGITWSSKMKDNTINKIFIAFVTIILIEKSTYFIF
ncbi:MULTISPECIES: sulfite exporter TauE/SafE family protein [unclassified Lentimicrobium]|uniref:sulfite exporter TauE/SafE family protein n=1 Tax=unclassified Lentimicrobium TaxID=2677434 RepID=UPI00155516BC|nr:MULTISPECIES: sulfite exporter TauE/SafE family protein [unclassified Lentimicrobium]NPD45981.1 sulfite exporter TauE/SafE family protein [Lentimicrobium sp. S6]NPD84252.1 sulfite exporter TauE/SafE family protein [Lentimicrobium sp. L6]